MKRTILIALAIALLSATAAEARLFGGRIRFRACRPAGTYCTSSPVAAKSQSSIEPRYEYRCDGQTCRRVRVD